MYSLKILLVLQSDEAPLHLPNRPSSAMNVITNLLAKQWKYFTDIRILRYGSTLKGGWSVLERRKGRWGKGVQEEGRGVFEVQVADKRDNDTISDATHQVNERS